MAQGPNVTQGATFCLVMVQIVISLHDYVRIPLRKYSLCQRWY